MKVDFDGAKRTQTLIDRGLDFADAYKIFDGTEVTLRDDRFEYPEPRFQTYGMFDNRLVMVAWTPIAGGIRVISMRRCNDRELRKFATTMGR